MSWLELKNTESANSNRPQGDKPNYIKFPVGTTPIRVIDEEPLSRWTHWIPQANGGKGLSVTCIGKQGCPVCQAMAADKAANIKTRYSARKLHAINVIDKRDGKVGIVDQSNKFFESLLTIMEQMGDLRNYDVSVTRKGTGFNDTEYTILPKFPPTPMTSSEMELQKYNLEEIYAPFTASEIVRFMNGATIEEVVKERDGGGQQQTATATPETNVPAEEQNSAPTIDFTQEVAF